MKYSKKVMDHFANPRNVGMIEDPDGVGEVGNPACGDIMTFTICVDDGIIKDVKFQTFGCGAAIAVSSMISEMAKGKTLDAALTITNQDVADALDGLPTNKLHCSNLGADALHAAIRDYREKHEMQDQAPKPREEEAPKMQKGKSSCKCPYCSSTENAGDTMICRSCGSRLQNHD